MSSPEIPNTYICTKCGEELEGGIMNHIRHEDTCKRDSPNSNIETHQLTKHWKASVPNEHYILVGSMDQLKAWEKIFDTKKVKLVEAPVFNPPELPKLPNIPLATYRGIELSGKEKRRNRRQQKRKK